MFSKATISANRAFESVTYPQPDPSGSCGFRWPAAALSYRHCGDTRTHTHMHTLSLSSPPLPSCAKAIASKEDRFSGCTGAGARGWRRPTRRHNPLRLRRFPTWVHRHRPNIHTLTRSVVDWKMLHMAETVPHGCFIVGVKRYYYLLRHVFPH